MKNNLEEYNTLRNEIISILELRRSVWINMYIIYTALIVLGFQMTHFLFLISYAIIIPFKCVIDEYSELMEKASCYIIVFFEKEYEIHWESLHRFEGYKQAAKNNWVRRILSQTSVAHLGLLSAILFIYYYMSECSLTVYTSICIVDLFWIVLTIILAIGSIVLSLNLDQPIRDQYMDVMESYKKSVQESNKEKDIV